MVRIPVPVPFAMSRCPRIISPRQQMSLCQREMSLATNFSASMKFRSKNKRLCVNKCNVVNEMQCVLVATNVSVQSMHPGC